MSLVADAGWFTPSILVLPLQAIAAVASVRVFAARVAPNITRLHAPASVTDSLGPFTLALPLICAGWRVGWNAAGNMGVKMIQAVSTMPASAPGPPTATKAIEQNVAGWITLGGPIVIAMLAIGAAMCVRNGETASSNDRPRISPAAIAAWCAVGGLLLLLGAAQDLTIWAGQCAFAAGAVFLWMNTPDLPRETPGSVDAQAGGGLTIVLLCGVVQAVAIGFVPMRFLPIAGAVAIANAGMLVALTTRLASPAAAVRIGGWTATYGILLGLGAISLRHLLPQMFAMASGIRDRPPLRVAYGFGAFALEASILLALGAAALTIDRIPARLLRVGVGVTLIIAAAGLTGWRLAGS